MTPVKRNSKQAPPHDVQTLRASLDSRLAALEDALGNPAKHASLESLILDLARAATEEADASVRQAVVNAHRDGQSAAGEAASALEAEVAGVRLELEDALASAEAERRRAANLEKAVEEVRGELQAGRTAIETQQREIATRLQEFASRHQSLEEKFRDEQAAHASARTTAEHARAEAEAERKSADRLLETTIQLERDLEAARSESTDLRRQLDEVRHDVDARAGEHASADRLLEANAQLERELEAARRALEDDRRELDGVRRELDHVRRELDARAETLSQSHTEHDVALKAAHDSAHAAEALIDEVLRERDGLRSERDALRNELALAQEEIREREALRRELEIAHEERDAARVMEAASPLSASLEPGEHEETIVDLTTETIDENMQRAVMRIRGLEVALRDAETRAESAELELELQRQTAGSPSDRPAVETPAEPSSPEPGKEFRGPARGAKRVVMTTDLDIQIDAAPGKLIDLSISGAQVLTSFSMKPNRLVKVTLPMGDSLIACKAKVAWSRLEPKAGQLLYRAGVAFMSADPIALEAFLSGHKKDV